MISYKGVLLALFAGRLLKENDDIVVCPGMLRGAPSSAMLGKRRPLRAFYFSQFGFFLE